MTKPPLPKRAPYKAHDDELKKANELGIRPPTDAETGTSQPGSQPCRDDR
jgi:hypothetical protein